MMLQVVGVPTVGSLAVPAARCGKDSVQTRSALAPERVKGNGRVVWDIPCVHWGIVTYSWSPSARLVSMMVWSSWEMPNPPALARWAESRVPALSDAWIRLRLLGGGGRRCNGGANPLEFALRRKRESQPVRPRASKAITARMDCSRCRSRAMSCQRACCRSLSLSRTSSLGTRQGRASPRSRRRSRQRKGCGRNERLRCDGAWDVDSWSTGNRKPGGLIPFRSVGSRGRNRRARPRCAVVVAGGHRAI